MPLVVGVDSSTSACKVEVRDADTGALVSSGRAPHPPTTPPRSEQHPDAWHTAFEAAYAEALAAAGSGRTDGIRAIAVAGQQHGLVVLDDAGRVLRKAKLWNDTESAPDADALVAELGARRWAAACGSVPLAAFTIAKVHWLRRCEPSMYAQMAVVMLPHDWLTRCLVARSVTDRGEASGTGWWSPAGNAYDPDLLALVGLSEAMVPTVLGPTEPAGDWGGLVVGPGTGDNMAAALGLGLRPGDLALSLGTSGTAFCVSVRPTADPTGTVAGFADATGRYLPLVCTLNATKVSDAVARLLGVAADELDALALAAPAGAGGLTLVPHFDGERTPNRPRATGLLHGIRSDVSREQLARAAIEGVLCNLLEGADHLPATDGRLVLAGGGARSAAYRQVVADLTQRPVFVPDDEELVARGAAIQAAAVLTGASLEDVAGEWRMAGATVDPDPTVDAAAIRSAYSDEVGIS